MGTSKGGLRKLADSPHCGTCYGSYKRECWHVNVNVPERRYGLLTSSRPPLLIALLVSCSAHEAALSVGPRPAAPLRSTDITLALALAKGLSRPADAHGPTLSQLQRPAAMGWEARCCLPPPHTTWCSCRLFRHPVAPWGLRPPHDIPGQLRAFPSSNCSSLSASP